METIFNDGKTKVSINDTYIKIMHQEDGKEICVQHEIYSLIEKLSEILKLNENENKPNIQNLQP